MIHSQKNPPFLLLPLFLLPLLQTLASSCTRTCGSRSVPFPFGFSAGCQIRLTCAGNATLKVGEFSIRNITSDRILLDVPPACNRTTQSAADFFSPNYALTNKNSLFLRRCSSKATLGCSISASLISDRLDYLRCPSKDKNISCYSNITTNGTDTDDDFLSETGVVHSTGCEFLFTTVKYETDAENVTSVVFSEAELGWWVHGECRCSANANCTRVKTPAGGPGFRCTCRDGYQGDGFAGGSGCVKG